MSQFSTNESVSLEKRINITSNIPKSNPQDIKHIYEVEKCAKWILENEYQKVCLQFPDYLLADATGVVKAIEKIIDRKVYILGDTAYESCCIDFTAASHISASAIIHFGNTCFSKTENIIPCLKIYEKYHIEPQIFYEALKNKFSEDQNIVIVVDTPYLHKIDEIRNNLNNNKYEILSTEDNISISDRIVVYIGENDRKLLNINLSFDTEKLYYFDPKSSNEIELYQQDIKILKRRYFLIEKIKDSSTIGIVISTLAVKNYLKILDRLKNLIKIHSKKYYVISVGKPTVAKLANFPEVDIFVVIGCAMNEIYENREFYKPIVTPFDIESALNPKLHNNHFSYDYNNYLLQQNEITDEILEDFIENDVSLVSGTIRPSTSDKRNNIASETTEQTDENKIARRDKGVLQVSDNFGAGFLANRSWKGLEQNLGKAEPKMAEEGRKGLAQGYKNEIE